ncbi:hypothetical protein OKW41_007365 [Paraburkholderia sp. UCT70]
MVAVSRRHVRRRRRQLRGLQRGGADTAPQYFPAFLRRRAGFASGPGREFRVREMVGVSSPITTIIMSSTEPVSPSTSPHSRARGINLNTPRALAMARILVPLCFGLYSLWLGADSNFDLYNYHMYNPFAWLHGKLQTDLAPPGIQSYFNPLLDLLFYLANTHLPSRVVGFAMGALHGLSFVFILAIVQKALPVLPEGDRYRVPLLLALAGCLTGNFLSGLGNSMGDDTTALFTLASLLMLLSGWERLGLWAGRAVIVTIASGFVMGLGAGLKLTNSVYAVALCAALLSYPDRAVVRLRLSVLFGIGVLLGLATTGGYWLFHMWKTFGNPLYPQFGMYFPNPLARTDAAGDARWRPHGWFDTAFWPFIFTANSQRVGETPIRQIIWPIAYVLFWLWLATSAIRMTMRRKTGALDPRARFVVLFVAIGYVMWMKMFSIYRYIVAVEVLTPFVIWMLLHQLLPYRPARRAAGSLIVIATAVVVTGGARTWGHEGWADPLYHAEVPAIAQPERTSVIIATTRYRAWPWLATLFPEKVAFMQLESSFPRTPAFDDRLREIVRERSGPAFAIIDGEYNWRIDNITAMNGLVDGAGLTRTQRGCDAMRWTITRLHLHASVVPAASGTRQCKLGLRADDMRDTAAENRADRESAIPMFERNGFALDPASCVPYPAGIGKGVLVYQWCRVSLRDGH